MNVSALRKEYSALTPFERAALVVQEAVGKRRESEIEALRVTEGDQWTRAWCRHWTESFREIADYAMFQAAANEAYGWQVLYFNEVSDEDNADKKLVFMRFAAKFFRRSLGWIAALKRLEEETGAPFTAAGEMLSARYINEHDDRGTMKALVGGTEENEFGCAREYNLLSEIWEQCATGVDEPDGHREWKHEPVEEPDEGLTALLDEIKAIMKEHHAKRKAKG